MSNKLENFIRNNREKLDQQTPGSDLWNQIQSGLAQNAAAGAASSGATSAATKSGLSSIAKLFTGWKLAAMAVVTIATAVTIYVASGSGENGGKENGTPTASNTEQTAEPGTKIEFVAQDGPLINPPIPQADIPYHDFSIDAKKGGTWQAPTGTIIKVPKNAFVDKDGKPVKGQVDIDYREFHDGADILLSGIPMTYDDNGTEEDFQTAGMMEIKGSQDGEPVYIADGREIEINMASFTDENDYNLYFLDPEKGKWVDIGMADMGKNEEKEKGLRLLGKQPEAPTQPAKGQPGVEKEGEISFAVNYADFPALKPFKKVRWEAKDKVRMKQNQWAFTQVWTDAKLEEVDAENMEYRMVLSNRRKKFSVDVRPVLEGQDYDKAMAKFKKKKARYDKLVAQQKIERKRLDAQADIMRSFSISGFGTYNCDRFYRMPNVYACNARFDFGEDAYMDANKTAIFHITGNNRSVITYNNAEVDGFRFSPDEENYLVAVLPGNKVSVFTNDDFRRLDRKRFIRPAKNVNAKHKEFTFEMTPSDKEVTNAAELRLLLGV